MSDVSPMMVKAAVCSAVLLCCLSLPTSSRADNSACWGDDSREDISCVRITEKLALSLRGQTPAAVRKTMNAPGRGSDNGLHFLSNYSRGEKDGSGDINVSFEGGKATSVYGFSDNKTGDSRFFIWSAYAAPPIGQEIDKSTLSFTRQLFCSDVSGKPRKCSGDAGMDAELTKMQMQGNLSKADLLKSLDVACNPGNGLAVSDPGGDCERLRNQLR